MRTAGRDGTRLSLRVGAAADLHRRVRSDDVVECGVSVAGSESDVRRSCSTAPTLPRDLLCTDQLLLILRLHLNLDAAWLDAFLQREREPQHAVMM